LLASVEEERIGEKKRMKIYSLLEQPTGDSVITTVAKGGNLINHFGTA